jgi:hypothetical protein
MNIQVFVTLSPSPATAEATLERREGMCGIVYAGTFYGLDADIDYEDDDWEVWAYGDFFVGDGSERDKCRAFMKADHA